VQLSFKKIHELPGHEASVTSLHNVAGDKFVWSLSMDQSIRVWSSKKVFK
jgi:WD domain, G-beta repeat.